MDEFWVSAGYSHRDSIELCLVGEPRRVKEANVYGCLHFLDAYVALKPMFQNTPVHEWQLPRGTAHEILILKEVILKAQSLWIPPYTDFELCHCRVIQTQVVDRAIIFGAHSSETVARLTSAGTGCGTCKPDIERMISHRLTEG